MNLTDRNKKLIAGGIALIAVLVVMFFIVRGRSGAPEAVTAGGGFAQGGEQVAGGPAAGPTGGTAGAPGAAGGAGRGGPGVGAAGGAPGGGAAGGAAGAGGGQAPPAVQYPSVGLVKMGIGPAEPTRVDPFLTFNPPVQAPPPELVIMLPPVGLVAGGLRPGGASETVAQIGNRRVAGLLFNDQAWAILEDEGGHTYVVKPGDVVEGIRIIAIARDSILLMDRDGKRWQVQLRGTGLEGRGGAGETTASAMPRTPPV